jgi:hypothetical protein
VKQTVGVFRLEICLRLIYFVHPEKPCLLAHHKDRHSLVPLLCHFESVTSFLRAYTLFQILFNAKKTIRTAREQINTTKQEDLLFLALDQLKEAEQMVAEVSMRKFVQ